MNIAQNALRSRSFMLLSIPVILILWVGMGMVISHSSIPELTRCAFFSNCKATAHPESSKIAAASRTAMLINQLSKHEGVMGAGMVEADMRTNTRRVVYHNISDFDLWYAFRKYVFEYGTTQPLFTTSTRAIDLMTIFAQPAVCTGFHQTMFYDRMPSVQEKVKNVCMLHVAKPATDKFMYILIMTEKEMDEAEFSNILQTVSEIRKQNEQL